MSSSSAIKWVPALLSVLVTTVGYSVPTPRSGDSAQGLCPSYANYRVSTPPTYPHTTTEILAPSNSFPANIVAELLKPPLDSTDSPELSAGTRPLPVVPGALFMVLTGFLCVSAVRDRKIWVAALAGLLWIGHIGREMIIARCSQLVAIPDTAKSVQRRAYTLNAKRHTTYDIRYTSYEQRTANMAAIDAVFSYPIEAANRLASITKWHFYFSPAFIFQNLARGPPEQAL